MPILPDDAVQAAMAALLALDHGDALTGEELCRVVLEAAAPVLAGHAAEAVLAHAEGHGPKAKRLRRAYRRHFGIAARVAAGAFTTREDHLRVAAEHVNAAYAVAKAREEISAQILAQKEQCTEPGHAMFPKPSCWTCGRNGAFHRAAMIAAGLRDGLEAKEEDGHG